MALETIRFDIQDFLKTPEDQAGILEAALEDGDPDLIATIIGDIARARGASQFAKDSGLSRETIYKNFRPGGNPTLATMAKAMKVLGLRLSMVPIEDSKTA
jgi:probable addiction module antidote protein